jgi:capsular polysaccharide biosynthesis protein
MTESVLQTIENAISRGDSKTARKLLKEFLKDNPRHEKAWLLLSGVAENDQRRCLEKVLRINPDNAEALSKLGMNANLQWLADDNAEDATELESNQKPSVTNQIMDNIITNPTEDQTVSAVVETSVTSMAQRRIFLALRSWWIVVLIVLAGIFGALFLSYFETPMYRTSARYLVSPPGSLPSSRDFTDNLDSQDNVMATFAEVLNSRVIREAALARLGLVKAVNTSTLTVVLPDTTILQTTITGPSPELLALLANAIGQEANSYIRSFYPFYEFTVLDSALIPSSSFSPNIPRTIIVATLLSFAIGVALAVLRAELLLFLENGWRRSNSEAT